MSNFNTQPLFDADITQTAAAPETPQTLEEKLIQDRQKHTADVTEMNNLMKTLPKLDELLTIIYAKRQELVDYYSAMNNVILNQNKLYKTKYNDMFNNVKLNGLNGLRLTTDSAIARCVEAELSEIKNQVDILINHNNYIKETIATVDNMIYGINQKIKLAEILNGIKY